MSNLSRFGILLTLFSLSFAQLINGTGNSLPCDDCALPLNWVQYQVEACGQDMKVYPNFLCNSTLASYLQCKIKGFGPKQVPVGISYPGVCGCPSYCMEMTGQGKCILGKCECASGWTGDDCSLVSLGNDCRERGRVTAIEGFTTCKCHAGYALNDCSAIVGTPPKVPQTLKPEKQYTDWDDYGNDHPIYNSSTIAQIRLTMPPEILYFQQNPNNTNSDQYFPVKMWFYNGAVTQVMDKVGFRLKGRASRSYVKKTFKLKFNEFVDKRKWAQQKTIELKALQQDPSGIKEKLCQSLFYSMNIPAQRSAYVQLFINEKFMGLYLMIEPVDDQFLKSRFDSEDGAFYKCVGDLAYLGEDPELYRNVSTGRGPNASHMYQPKSDAAEDFTLLRDFIKVINASSDLEFVSGLEEMFDTDLYAKTLAMEVLTGNWDGLWNANNFYLYHNPAINKFQYLRHDFDMSFGTWDTFFGAIDKDIYKWGDGGKGYRLINRFLANEPFRSQFTQYLLEAVKHVFNLQGDFVDYMDFLSTELHSLMRRDVWRQTDFAWSYQEYMDILSTSIIRKTGNNWGGRGFPEVVTWGIRDFMQTRVRTAYEQMNGN